MSGGELVDQTVREGGRYEFRLRYVYAAPRVDVLGTFSEIERISVEDRSAPYPPLGLKLEMRPDGFCLSWDAVRDDNLLGYYVYLRKQGDSVWKRLTKKPVPQTRYCDKISASLGPHELAVSAIDGSPRRNESVRSVAIPINPVPVPEFVPPKPVPGPGRR